VEPTVDTLESAKQQCIRCGTAIDDGDLRNGTAIRVLGRLVCPHCIDSDPVRRSNQQGLPRRVYRLEDEQHPDHNRYTFITAAHLAVHRRYLATTGLFPAPPLPADGSGMHRLPSGVPGLHVQWLIAGGTAAAVLAILALALLFSGGETAPRHDQRPITPTVDPERPARRPPTLPTSGEAPEEQHLRLTMQLAAANDALARGERQRVSELLATLVIPGDPAFDDLRRQRQLLQEQLDPPRSPPPLDPPPKEHGPSRSALNRQLATITSLLDAGNREHAARLIDAINIPAQHADLQAELDSLRERLTTPPQPPEARPDEPLPPDPAPVETPVEPVVTPVEPAPVEPVADPEEPAAPTTPSPTTRLLVGKNLQLGGGKPLQWRQDTIPANLPLPAGPRVYESKRSGHQMLQLQCQPADLAAGGISLLLHPGDPRREAIEISFLDEGSRRSTTRLVFADQVWQELSASPLTGTIEADFDPSTINRVQIHDLTTTTAGLSFYCAGAILSAGAAPAPGPWRPRRLLVSGTKELADLYQRIMDLRQGKGRASPVVSKRERQDPTLAQILMDREAAQDATFRDPLRDAFAALTGCPADEAVVSGEFSPNWIDKGLELALMKGRKPQVILCCFRGYDALLADQQALDTWRRLILDCITKHGVLPVVVLGPMKGLDEQERQKALDKYYPALIEWLAKRCGDVPVIDLRHAALSETGRWQAHGGEAAAAQLLDGYRELCQLLGVELAEP
jgi:hypothetical protein